MPFVLSLLVATTLHQTRPAVLGHVNAWISRDVAPGAKVRLTINTENVPVVTVAAYRVDGMKWLSRDHQPGELPAPIGDAYRRWTLSIARPEQKINTYSNYFSRQVNIGIETPGVYLLRVAGGGSVASCVANITDLAVVQRRSTSQGLTWVTHWKTKQVLPDAEVLYFTRDGREVKRWTTGKDGVANGQLPREAQLLVVRSGKDLAGLPAEPPYYDGQLRAFFQTDRPIYRPGQTIYFKAALRLTRGQGYDVVRNSDVTVRLRDPKDNPLEEVHVVPTAAGTISGSFKIPVEGMIGPYTLGLLVDKQTAMQTVSVAAYRKPEFKVDVTTPTRHFLSGEELPFKVDSAYYFGAPVPQAEVTWIARRSGMSFYHRGMEDRWFYGGDGNLYSRDTYNFNPVVGEGRVFTDNLGHVTIPVPTDRSLPDCDYSLDVTVIDGSRRQVTGSSSVPVFASLLRLGVTSEKYMVPLGGLIPVSLELKDLDDNPSPGLVTLRVLHPEWIEKEARWVDKEIARTQIKVPSSGRARANLPARKDEELKIVAEVTDSTGRQTSSTTSVYVADPDYKEKETVEPKLDTRLDKRVYEVGDTVHAYIDSNSKNRPILLVAEGRDIWTYKVVAKSTLWDVKTTLAMAPNAYITASQWTPQGMRHSSALVPVPDRSKLLTVSAKADKPIYRPGDTAHYMVRTTDSKGKPVPSEVTLSVVDEAIYALSPDNTADAYSMYWGLRGDQVLSMESAPEELSGGAYQRANPSAPVRSRFEDTAYWNPLVNTGPNGSADITFEMPGNLTTWRATARAITPETRVGIDSNKVLATRPLTLRLATPRQMVQGDQLQLIGTVNNRSSVSVHVNVELAPDGISVDGPLSQKILVPAKSEGKVQWRLRAASVPATGQAVLTARATALDASGPDAPDMADALRMSLPVIPHGLQHSRLASGMVDKTVTRRFELPFDTMADGGYLKLTVSGGITPLLNASAQNVLRSWRYGSPAGANILEAAVAIGPQNAKDDVREALALLSRTETQGGWGWWENCPRDPIITSRVTYSLGLAQRSGIKIFDEIIRVARDGSTWQYNQTQLWEHRALLAAAHTLIDPGQGLKQIEEVRERGMHMSPYAKLRMAEALELVGHRDAAKELLHDVLPLVSDGSDSSYLPVGFGIGWTASTVETTAQLLTVLCEIAPENKLGSKLCRWLVLPDEREYRSTDDNAAVARALAKYANLHPDPTRLGVVKGWLNGAEITFTPSTVGMASTAEVFGVHLLKGANEIKLERDGDGSAFYRTETRFYQPQMDETHRGVRVVRRYEVRNDADMWVELDRPVIAGEPVRCTVVVWGDDIPDAVKISEPLPSGFEFVDSEYAPNSREEVRDAAVVHFLMNAGHPSTFRYFIRAENDGNLTALPPVAEYLRRPEKEGHGAAEQVTVVGKK